MFDEYFLEENPDRAPPGVVWPERPNREDTPLATPDPVAPSQDMIDAQQRERERIAAEKIQEFQMKNKRIISSLL